MPVHTPIRIIRLLIALRLSTGPLTHLIRDGRDGHVRPLLTAGLAVRLFCT
jgi:hypothetical protein